VRAGRTLVIGAAAVAGIALIFGMFVWLPRLTTRATSTGTVGAAAAPVAAAAPGRKIKARLFYVADNGTKLTSVERDVPYGDGPIEQAREILTAQIAPVVEPLVSAVPAGTSLRAVFITENGEAFVDLSGEVVSAHIGGTLGELLTVYTIVNALTENLPAIAAVQVLVDGKEVETLSGHIDLRRPLAKNLTWVQ
jgi:spore germination protein GerM